MPYSRPTTPSTGSSAPPTIRSGYTRPTTTPPKKKGGGFGIPKIVKGLAGDIESTALGLGPQLVDLARGLGETSAYITSGRTIGSPKRLERMVSGIGKSYEQTYSPLVHGDFGKFWDQFESHPLGPILDAITVATLGAGGSVKGAAALQRAGAISKVPKFLEEAPRVRGIASPRVRTAQELEAPWGGTLATRPVTGGELVRRLKLGSDSLLKKLPPEFQVLGEYNRYARAVVHQLAQKQAGSLLKVLPWYKISAKLSREEGIALTLRSMFPTEGLLKSYQGLLMRNKKAIQETTTGAKFRAKYLVPDTDFIEAMSHPKVLEYFRNPTQNMIDARMTAEAMDKVWTDALVGAGALTRDQAEWIRWEPVLVAMGAKYKTLTREEALANGINIKLAEAKNFKILEPPMEFKVWRDGELVQGTLDDMIAQIRKEIQNNSPEMKALKADMAKTKVAPENVDQLNSIGTAMMERAPSVFDEPMYFPHVAEMKDVRIPRVGGGMVYPKSPVEIRSGVLQNAGRMILDPQVWTVKFLENAKFLYYRDKHSALINAAVPIEAKELPQGWRFITRKDERLAQIERTSASFDEYLTNLKKDLGEDPFAALGKTGTPEDLITTSADEAMTDAVGNRLALPEKTARKIIGDYTRSTKSAARWLRDFTTVWRAFVLNLRVGWLMNNVLGNTLLYAIKNAGPEGIRSYIQAVGDAFGENAVKKLWQDEKVRSHLTAKDMMELFPEQYVGTFFGTQIPTYGRIAGMKAFTGKMSPFRAMRSVDVHYEQALRRAMVDKLVKQSPEFRKVWHEMPDTTRTIREAERTALQRNPRLVQRISQEVNDSLGDFFNMSDFERRFVRGLMPFYAWYRAITTIMIKLPVDSPLRTEILVNMGRLGDEIASEDYGVYYLKGGYPLPGLGPNTMLRTKAANPFSTPIDEARAAMAAVAPGATQTDIRTLTGMFNPGWWEPLYGLARAESGATSYTPGMGPIPGAFYEIVRGLPQATLVQPYPSKLYENQTQLRNILNYLGIPIKTINPVEAQNRGKTGR